MQGDEEYIMHLNKSILLMTIVFQYLLCSNLIAGGSLEALYKACKIGNLDKITQELTKDPELIHQKIHNNSLAKVAVLHNQFPVLQLLYKKGAKMEEFTTPDESLLMCAAKTGNLEIATFLISCGVDVNQINHNDTTAFFYALHYKKVPVVRLLMKHGCQARAANRKGINTLLLAVTLDDATDIIQYILQQTQTTTQDSPRMVNCIHHRPSLVDCIKKNKIPYLKLLLPYLPTSTQIEVDSLLHVAVESNNLEALKLLVEHGLNVNMQDILNRSALHIASKCGLRDHASYLLEQGADINCQDTRGQTPAMLAFENEQEQIFSDLVKYKSLDFLVADDKKKTILHQIIEYYLRGYHDEKWVKLALNACPLQALYQNNELNIVTYLKTPRLDTDRQKKVIQHIEALHSIIL